MSRRQEIALLLGLSLTVAVLSYALWREPKLDEVSKADDVILFTGERRLLLLQRNQIVKATPWRWAENRIGARCAKATAAPLRAPTVWMRGTLGAGFTWGRTSRIRTNRIGRVQWPPVRHPAVR